MKHSFFKFLSFFFITSIQLWSQSDLQNYFNGIRSNDGLPSALIGICVKAEDGTKIASFNEDILLAPASCQKLVTTSTALMTLGPDFKFETTIQYDGTLDPNTGILKGNVFIRGGGDPTFCSEKYSSTSISLVMDNIAGKIKNLGIKKIDGKVIGDDAIFESIMAPGTWDWGDIGQYYGAGASGLTIADNILYYYLKTGSANSPSTLVRTEPYIPGLTVINDVKSGIKNSGDDSFVFGSEYTYYRHIVGTVSGYENEFKVKGSLPDPALFAAYITDSILEQNGITITGSPTTTRILREGNISYTYSKSRKEIYTIYSPELRSIIKQINVYSNNLYAEQLHKYLSFYKNGFGNNLASNDIVRDYWVNKGIPENEIIPVDGSGLARSNAISASALTDLLIMMQSEKYFEDFYNSLPIGGKSGTMYYVGKGTILENNLHAKSGSMTRVRSYAGYLTSKSGKKLVFTLLFNNYTCKSSEIKKICNAILLKIAELG